MMKRIITFILTTFVVCTAMWANSEHDVTLAKNDSEGKREPTEFGVFTFRLIESNDKLAVQVTIENTTPDNTFLLFKQGQGETMLKGYKPKVQVAKNCPIDTVRGCKKLNDYFVQVSPSDNYIFKFDVASHFKEVKLELPVYIAKYHPKKLFGILGKEHYEILNEEILKFNLKIKGWSEDDPEYVSLKKDVEGYIQSVDEAPSFCRNKKHFPSLEEQQKPYKEKRDSLLKVIQKVLDDHNWMIDMPQYQYYSKLMNQLKEVDLDAHTYDCGKHKSKHSCSYCKWSAQRIYHEFDDTYQQLRAGKLDKDAAVKKAKGLNTCYQKNTKRKKDSDYTEKISLFYDRIINY